MTLDMRLIGSFSGCFLKTFANPPFVHTNAYRLGHHGRARKIGIYTSGIGIYCLETEKCGKYLE